MIVRGVEYIKVMFMCVKFMYLLLFLKFFKMLFLIFGNSMYLNFFIYVYI